MLNEMMHRPVVMEKIVQFMREEQKPFEGVLGEIQQYANELGIPIIPHETAVFIDMLCAIIQPKNILEIGTAIGYSGSLMARYLPEDGKLITIDRYAKMYERAKVNFERMGLTDKIELLEGDAADILPELTGSFDLIFMDSAKAKYVEFLPYLIERMHVGSVLLIDDVFQGGTILDDESEIPKRVRKIHRKLNELFETVHQNSSLRSSIIPLGDGVLMIRKEK